MKSWQYIAIGGVVTSGLLYLTFSDSNDDTQVLQVPNTVSSSAVLNTETQSVVDSPDFIPKKVPDALSERASNKDVEAQLEKYQEQYETAKRRFEQASPTEQKQTRFEALDKILSDEPLGPIHEVAVQQPWEREGRIKPNSQFTPEEKTSITVNGMEMDLSFTPDYVSTELMIYATDDNFVSELSALGSVSEVSAPFANMQRAATTSKRDMRNWRKVTLSVPADDIAMVSKVLETFDEVSVSEPVVERRINGIPVSAINDTKYADQWYLDAANVKQAWASLEAEGLPAGGSSDVVVAVIDSGVDYKHPDLVNNMWVNPGEIPNNGIDDDGNGFVDDVHGVDVLSQPSNHNGDPQDVHGHGTHVAGIIAAEGGNNQGIVGVAYNTKIMAIKAAQYSGILTSADVAEAIMYSVEHGADVINMSFGGYGRSQVEEDALATAYSQAVLISSAGNDGKPNQYECKGAPSYPASYPWVVGVMATQEFANEGGFLTGFSNRDCVADNGIEYEVMAPGSDIWSTLPNNSYGAWDGTSMAAPVVSGVAALVRSKWPDKTQFSSRFVMGQIASTGGFERAFVDPMTNKQISYRESDAHLAITSTPSPKLTLEANYIFDKVSLSGNNDEDGRVDAGETIELALQIRNRWGKADNVEVTISTPSGTFASDPNVTLVTDTVNYGAVGSFNVDDNGLIYDGELVTGVTTPFVFSIANSTPNNHVIPFTVTMTAKNGLDDSDETVYTFDEQFFYSVQKGRQLPNIIASDAAGTPGGNLDTDGVEDGVVTLDDSSLWIVDHNVLVDDDVTLKFTDGAYVQFWSSQPDTPQTPLKPAFIRVEGKLVVEADPTNRVVFKPSTLYPNHAVQIRTAANGEMRFDGVDIENYVYFGGQNTGANITLLKNSIIRQRGVESVINWYDMSKLDFVSRGFGYDLLTLKDNPDSTGNQFYKLGKIASWQKEINADDNYRFDVNHIRQSLFDNSSFIGTNFEDSVFLNNGVKNSAGGFSSSKVEDFSGYRLSTSDVLEFQGNSYVVIDIPSSLSADIEKEGVSILDEIETIEGFSFFSPESHEELAAMTFFSGLGRIHLDASEENENQFKWNGSELEFPNTIRKVGTIAIGYSYIPRVENQVKYLAIIPSSTHIFLYERDSYSGKFLFKKQGSLNKNQVEAYLENIEKKFQINRFSENAILTNYNDLNANKWLSIIMPSNSGVDDNDNTYISLANNYWGTTQTRLIEEQIIDVNDNFSLAEAIYQPILATPSETTYPFVVDVQILDSAGNEPGDKRYGIGASTWRVTFNRDMDTTKQPVVTFGPAEPFTDFQIGGDWTDARTWEGKFAFSPTSGDGLQKIRVIGAVAADNPALVTGDDKERFQFELITSGVEALTMQATGGERDQVTLNWTQDDFDLLNGYNVYRSMSEDGTYIRLNSSTLNKDITSFVDDDVSPGVPHYYYFTVVTGRAESDPSNIAMAVPQDTIPPVVSHQPKTVVQSGSALTVRATITDNIRIANAQLIYRQLGDSDWITRDMVNPSGTLYTITLNTSEIGDQGIEYYILANDGDSTATSGTESQPFTVTVALASDLDSDGDGVSNADDLFPFNRNEFADNDLDGIGNNADTDDDNDLVLDVDDAFPNDPDESIDTDGDGLGNNADSDDDGDGVDDSADRFPLDDRGALDNDRDGMPDEWEDTNGLDKNNRFDALNDLDLDGVTNLAEFENNTDPQQANDDKQQVVYLNEQVLNRLSTNFIPVLYTTQDSNANTTGLGLRVHVKRAQVESVGLENLLNLDLLAFDPTLRSEQGNEDNNPNTDAYLTVAWASQSAAWPGQINRKLFDIALKVNEQIPADELVHVDFSTITNDRRYRFAKQSYQLAQSEGALLDIDNDGAVDALTDGLLLLRYMFGFEADALVSNVVGIEAKRNDALTIAQYMDDNRTQFDIDGNGQVDALTDGILILRYMFTFRGNTLIANDVIGDNATRTTAAEIENVLAIRSGEEVSGTVVPPSGNTGNSDDTDSGEPDGGTAARDSDSDGVPDTIDAAPTDASITKAIKFNLADVDAMGMTESINEASNGELVFKSQKHQPLLRLFKTAYADGETIVLANTTNIQTVDDLGSAVDDAVLASEPFFVSETVVTPDGRYAYMLTSPRLQESIDGLPPEVCHLYVVTLADNSFICALNTEAPEPEPAQLNGNSRIWAALTGIQFRIDNTGVFKSGDNAYLIKPNFEIVELPRIIGESIGLNAVGWLDDQHVFTVTGCSSEDCTNELVMNAINVDSLEVVASAVRGQNSGEGLIDFGLISQRDDVVFVGQRAVRWTGTDFVEAQAGGGIETIVDQYGRTWAFVDHYEGDTPKLLTSTDGTIRIELGQEAKNAFNDQPLSGSGSGVAYKNFAFAQDYVFHKFGMNAKAPIQTLAGNDYTASSVYELENDQGFIYVDNRFTFWYYVPTANSVGDVVIPYTVKADGQVEERSITIPASAVSAFLTQNPNPINLLEQTDEISVVIHGNAINLFTPEPDRIGFCVYQISTELQQCAELNDYASTNVFYDRLQGSEFLPDDYYQCIDGNCGSGVQNLVFLGENIIGYFRDDTDGQFYSATANLNEFMSVGESSLTFSPVTNKAGESEIMASANAFETSAKVSLNDVKAEYTNEQVVIDFGVTFNQTQDSPVLTLTAQADISDSFVLSSEWGTNGTSIVADLSLENMVEGTVYTVVLDRFVFAVGSDDSIVAANTLEVTIVDDRAKYIDTDNDGVSDFDDGFVNIPIGNYPDNDRDGRPDDCPAECLTTGMGADDDDDNDGLADVSDDFPLDPGNIIDSDNDGVADRFDMFPNDASKDDQLVVNLASASDIGLGEAIDVSEDDGQVSRSTRGIFSLAYADDEVGTSLGNRTNAIVWDESGDVDLSSILTDKTLFIAEAVLTPNGKYLYLLTSAHIQSAMPQLDDESCSMYRVDMHDNSVACLLATSDGDIEPKSINGSMRTDYSRRGIDMRSDGAGVMRGFDWNRELPDGVNGGTNSTIAWHLSSTGKLTPVYPTEYFFVVGAQWLNDEYFVVVEQPINGEEGQFIEGARGQLVIYDGNTLERVKAIAPNQGVWGQYVKNNGNLYWNNGGALNGDTLAIMESPYNGIVLGNHDATKIYDLEVSSGINNVIRNADDSIRIPLSDGVGRSYNWEKGSGTGTDINYSNFAFTDDYIAYSKVYGALNPIQSIEGQTLLDGRVEITLDNGRGLLKVEHDNWYFYPDGWTGDLTVSYEVQTDNGTATGDMTIDAQTIANWQADSERPSLDNSQIEDAGLKWVAPALSSEREGVCVYDMQTQAEHCALLDGLVLVTDLESYRSKRYDGNAVFPNQSGNAYPGIRNIFIRDNQLSVFFKDSTDNSYREATAAIADFKASGESAFTYASAVNGTGEQNIITAAIRLKPLPAKVLEGVSISQSVADTWTINFGQALSSVAPLPQLAVSVDRVQMTFTTQWDDARNTVELQFEENVTYDENASEVRAVSAIFLPNQIQQYMLNDDDFPTGNAPLSAMKATTGLFVHGKSDVAGGSVYDESNVEVVSSHDSENGDGEQNNGSDENVGHDETGDASHEGSQPVRYEGCEASAYCHETDDVLFYLNALSSQPREYATNLPDDFVMDVPGSPLYINFEYEDVERVFTNISQSCLASGDVWGCENWQVDIDADVQAAFVAALKSDSIIMYSDELSYIDEFGGNVNGKRVRYTLIQEQGVTLADADVKNRFMNIYRPLSGQECSRHLTGALHWGDSQRNDAVRFFASESVHGLLGESGQQEVEICSDMPSGINEITLTGMDGLGGKKSWPVTVAIHRNRIDGGEVSFNGCFDNYCAVQDGQVIYNVAVTSNESSYPYFFTGTDFELLELGGMQGSGFEILDDDLNFVRLMIDGEQNMFVSTLNNILRQAQELEQKDSFVLRAIPDVLLENSINIKDQNSLRKGELHFRLDEQVKADNVRAVYSRVVLQPPVSGTGTGTDWDPNTTTCSEYSLVYMFEEFNELSQLRTVPSTKLDTGGEEGLLQTFNKISICSDTEVGEYNVDIVVLDGVGGKATFPLNLQVLDSSVEAGSVSWQ